MPSCYVYILASRSRRLYIGVTRNLARRVDQHRAGASRGFAHRYSMVRLVHFETTSAIRSAIAREKQLKGRLRARKIALIEAANPEWDDLYPEPPKPDARSRRSVEGSFGCASG